MAKQKIYRQLRNDLNRRAKDAGSEGELSYADLYAVAEFYKHHCLVPDCTKEDYQFDHVIPLEKKGANARSNLQLLCESHNKSKQEIDYRPTDKPFCPDSYIATDYEEPEETSGIHIDWERIRTRYITEEISTRELAEQEEINEKTVAQRAYRGNWVGLRDNYCRKLSSQVVQTLAEQEINARVIAGHTAKAVIESWTYSPRQEAKASDALDAAKLLLTLAGQPTEIRELHIKLVAAIVGTDELGQTGGAEGGQPSSSWLRSIASTSTDSPST
jgi:hypothetical protein